MIEGAHEAFKNQSYSHGVVDTKELGNSMTLKEIRFDLSDRHSMF